jgi:hypothetical protein
MAAGDVAQTWIGTVERRFAMLAHASCDTKDANGTIVRYREAATESGQRRDGHAAARHGGGARIEGARASSSTTRMAAPQCGHTKVAEAVVVEACCVEIAGTSSGTCSNSRARARCSRRPAGEQAIVADPVEAAGKDV